MRRPFIILAQRRTGTKMLVSALGSHPDLPPVIHEFGGGLWQFLKHPYVLANRPKWWMRFFRVVHVYREDAIAGARSLMLMPYAFPDHVVTLPVQEVLDLANRRQEWDASMARIADYSISYEIICAGGRVTVLPDEVSRDLCQWLRVAYHPLCATTALERKLLLKNEDEVQCLVA